VLLAPNRVSFSYSVLCSNGGEVYGKIVKLLTKQIVACHSRIGVKHAYFRTGGQITNPGAVVRML